MDNSGAPGTRREWALSLSSVIPLLYLSGGFMFAARFPAHALAQGWIASAVAAVIMEVFIVASGLLYVFVLREEGASWRILGTVAVGALVLGVLIMFWQHTGATPIVAGALLVMLGRSITTIRGDENTRYTLRARLFTGMWLLGMSTFAVAFVGEVAPGVLRVNGAAVYLGVYYLVVALIDIVFPFFAVWDMSE
jgi:hypothetical protein